jgi:hypothetical protein
MDGIGDIIKWAMVGVGSLVAVGVALLVGVVWLQRRTALKGG